MFDEIFLEYKKPLEGVDLQSFASELSKNLAAMRRRLETEHGGSRQQSSNHYCGFEDGWPS